MPRLALIASKRFLMCLPQAATRRLFFTRIPYQEAKFYSQSPESVKAMSQPEDDSICQACDFLLRNNRDTGYSHKSSAWRPFDDWDDLEGIWGPINISIAGFERELIHHRTGRGVQAGPKCALFQLFLRAIELSFDRKLSAKYLKDDAVVLSLLKIENYSQSEKGAKTCKIRIVDTEPPDRHRLAADFG
jgi:hypothetical protein